MRANALLVAVSTAAGGWFCAGDAQGAATFVRGDFDSDGKVNLTDAISLLSHLFMQNQSAPCASAGDVNDDGTLNVTDVIAMLNFLFLGRSAPAFPFPGCGSDITPDQLACAVSVCPPEREMLLIRNATGHETRDGSDIPKVWATNLGRALNSYRLNSDRKVFSLTAIHLELEADQELVGFAGVVASPEGKTPADIKIRAFFYQADAVYPSVEAACAHRPFTSNVPGGEQEVTVVRWTPHGKDFSSGTAYYLQLSLPRSLALKANKYIFTLVFEGQDCRWYWLESWIDYGPDIQVNYSSPGDFFWYDQPPFWYKRGSAGVDVYVSKPSSL